MFVCELVQFTTPVLLVCQRLDVYKTRNRPDADAPGGSFVLLSDQVRQGLAEDVVPLLEVMDLQASSDDVCRSGGEQLPEPLSTERATNLHVQLPCVVVCYAERHSDVVVLDPDPVVVPDAEIDLVVAGPGQDEVLVRPVVGPGQAEVLPSATGDVRASEALESALDVAPELIDPLGGTAQVSGGGLGGGDRVRGAVAHNGPLGLLAVSVVTDEQSRVRLRPLQGRINACIAAGPPHNATYA